MDNLLNIKRLSREYFVTLDGKPVCPGVNDEPGVFDNDILPIYRSFVNMFGDERVKMVSVTTFVEKENLDEVLKNESEE